MKNFIVTVFFLFFLTATVKAQGVKVYRTFEMSYAHASETSDFRMNYGEMLHFRGKVPLQVLAGVDFGYNFFKAGEYPLKGKSGETLSLQKNIKQPYLSLPLGIELRFKNIGIGVSQQLLTLNFNRTIDSSYVDPVAHSMKSKVFGTPFYKGNNTSSQIYIAATFDIVTIIAGYKRRQSLFNLYDEDREIINNMAIKGNMPFFALRFNIEK